jgi:hypothetical protein
MALIELGERFSGSMLMVWGHRRSAGHRRGEGTGRHPGISADPRPALFRARRSASYQGPAMTAVFGYLNEEPKLIPRSRRCFLGRVYLLRIYRLQF